MATSGDQYSVPQKSFRSIPIGATWFLSTNTFTETTVPALAPVTRRVGRDWSRSSSSKAVNRSFMECCDLEPLFLKVPTSQRTPEGPCYTTLALQLQRQNFSPFVRNPC